MMPAERTWTKRICTWQNRYIAPRVCFIFWTSQLIVVLFAQFIISDPQLLTVLLCVWSIAVCFPIIVFHHFYSLGDKNVMVLPLLFYIPYWIIFFLIPIRSLLQADYTVRTAHLVAEQFWPAVVFAGAVGICSFQAGYTLLAKRKVKNSLPALQFREKKTVIATTAWGTFALTSIFFLLFILAGGTALFGDTYVHITHLSWFNQVLFIILETVLMGTVGIWAIYLLYEKKAHLLNLLPVVIISLIALSFLLSGDRGFFAHLVITVVVIYSLKHRIRLVFLLLAIVIASILFSAIQEVRQKDLSIDNCLSVFTEEITLFKGVMQVAENSAPTVTNAFAVVEEEGHSYGLFFVQGGLSIIPLYSKIFPWLPAAQHAHLENTGTYVTHFVFGSHPYGLATTVVTDVYIDFALPGVIVLLFVFGSLGGCLYNIRFSGKYRIGTLFYAFFVPAYMYSTRGSITSPLRTLWVIAFCSLVLLLTSSVLQISRKSHRRMQLKEQKDRNR